MMEAPKHPVIAYLESETDILLAEFFAVMHDEFNLPEFTTLELEPDADSFYSGYGPISVAVSIFDEPKPIVRMILGFSGDGEVLHRFTRAAEQALEAPVALLRVEGEPQDD